MPMAILSFLKNMSLEVVGSGFAKRINESDPIPEEIFEAIDSLRMGGAIEAVNEFIKRYNQKGNRMQIGIGDAAEILEEMFPGSVYE